jgi:transcriptional regulator with AAA-type ATPase domain
VLLYGYKKASLMPLVVQARQLVELIEQIEHVGSQSVHVLLSV